MTVRDDDKPAAVEIARGLVLGGHKIFATRGTAAALTEAGIQVETIGKISSGTPNLLDLVLGGGVSLMINTPSTDRVAELEAGRIRRSCIETGVPCVTSIDTATALLRALEVFRNPQQALCLRLDEYFLGEPAPAVSIQ